MSDTLKTHLESFLLTFIGSFVVAVCTAVSIGQLDLFHLTSGAVVSVLIAAAQSALKVAWNKAHYGNVAGVKQD